jgi:hypothetical protein
MEDWRQGRHFGYPPCCIAHFCWDSLVGWPSGVVRWHQIDTDPHDPTPQVVCGIFHGGGSPYGLGRRLWEILVFQWRHLLPTPAARRRLDVATGGSRRWRTAWVAEKVWASEHGQQARLYWDDGGLDPELDWS